MHARSYPPAYPTPFFSSDICQQNDRYMSEEAIGDQLAYQDLSKNYSVCVCVCVWMHTIMWRGIGLNSWLDKTKQPCTSLLRILYDNILEIFYSPLLGMSTQK